jgi:hypothetical protein
MAQPIGYNFAPTFANAEFGKQGGAPPTSAQQALQTLSFRLGPRVAGAPGGLSPLQGTAQAGSSISSAVLASVLRTVLGADATMDMGDGRQSFSPGTMPGAGGLDPGVGQFTGNQMPNPVIHPGQDAGESYRVAQPTSTPRGTADPTHAGLQDFFSQERQQAMGYAPSSMSGLNAMAGPWGGYR